ncbi:hypothetical protein SNEBB_003788 [Seison nebaliae]|nr:hypothetical protein SNEBB_003788 [Seison nebaliae]
MIHNSNDTTRIKCSTELNNSDDHEINVHNETSIPIDLFSELEICSTNEFRTNCSSSKQETINEKKMFEDCFHSSSPDNTSELSNKNNNGIFEISSNSQLSSSQSSSSFLLFQENFNSNSDKKIVIASDIDTFELKKEKLWEEDEETASKLESLEESLLDKLEAKFNSNMEWISSEDNTELSKFSIIDQATQMGDYKDQRSLMRRTSKFDKESCREIIRENMDELLHDNYISSELRKNRKISKVMKGKGKKDHGEKRRPVHQKNYYESDTTTLVTTPTSYTSHPTHPTTTHSSSNSSSNRIRRNHVHHTRSRRRNRPHHHHHRHHHHSSRNSDNSSTGTNDSDRTLTISTFLDNRNDCITTQYSSPTRSSSKEFHQNFMRWKMRQMTSTSPDNVHMISERDENECLPVKVDSRCEIVSEIRSSQKSIKEIKKKLKFNRVETPIRLTDDDDDDDDTSTTKNFTSFMSNSCRSTQFQSSNLSHTYSSICGERTPSSLGKQYVSEKTVTSLKHSTFHPIESGDDTKSASLSDISNRFEISNTKFGGETQSEMTVKNEGKSKNINYYPGAQYEPDDNLPIHRYLSHMKSFQYQHKSQKKDKDPDQLSTLGNKVHKFCDHRRLNIFDDGCAGELEAVPINMIPFKFTPFCPIRTCRRHVEKKQEESIEVLPKKEISVKMPLEKKIKIVKSTTIKLRKKNRPIVNYEMCQETLIGHSKSNHRLIAYGEKITRNDKIIEFFKYQDDIDMEFDIQSMEYTAYMEYALNVRNDNCFDEIHSETLNDYKTKNNIDWADINIPVPFVHSTSQGTNFFQKHQNDDHHNMFTWLVNPTLSPKLPYSLPGSKQPTDSGILMVSDCHGIFYEVFGESWMPAVLILHDGPGFRRMPEILRTFSNDTFRIVTFDQRGCGLSIALTYLHNNTTWMTIGDIEKLRIHLRVNCWLIILGVGWGATLALFYTQAYNDICAQLILVSLPMLEKNAWITEIRSFLRTNKNEDTKLFSQKISSHNNFIEEFYERLKNTKLLTTERVILAKIYIHFFSHYNEEHLGASCIPIQFSDKEYLKAASIHSHYLVNDFFALPFQFIKDIYRINHIPCTLIQVKRSQSSLIAPSLLHKYWPDARCLILNGRKNGDICFTVLRHLRQAIAEIELKYKKLSCPASKRSE